MIPLSVVTVVPVRTLIMATFTAVTVATGLREMEQMLVTVLSPVLVCSICNFAHVYLWFVFKVLSRRFQANFEILSLQFKITL